MYRNGLDMVPHACFVFVGTLWNGLTSSTATESAGAILDLVKLTTLKKPLIIVRHIEK